MKGPMPLGTRVWSLSKLFLLAGLLLATFLVFFGLSMRAALQSREVKVPALVGRSIGEATQALNDLGLPMRVDETLAIAALIQATLAKLYKLHSRNQAYRVYGRALLMENKWRAARYGLEARVIVDRDGTQRLVTDHLRETMDQLGHIAEELHCAREFAGLEAIMSQGASYARQRMVADAADGDLREVVQHLIREFRAGPTLREHLAALGH